MVTISSEVVSTFWSSKTKAMKVSRTRSIQYITKDDMKDISDVSERNDFTTKKTVVDNDFLCKYYAKLSTEPIQNQKHPVPFT
jgi:hypothetical protein